MDFWTFAFFMVNGIGLFVVFVRQGIANNERTTIFKALEQVNNTALHHVQNHVNSILKTTTEGIKADQKNTLENIRREQRSTLSSDLYKLKNQFKNDTKKYFNTTQAAHITASKESVKEIIEQKEELEKSFIELRNEYDDFHNDLKEAYNKLLLAAKNQNIKFYPLPGNNTDFDFYLCQSTNTFHKVPKSFKRWAPGGTKKNIIFVCVIYTNIDDGEIIYIPAELLQMLKTNESQPVKPPVTDVIDDFNPLICPVCLENFTDPLYNRMHLDQKQDEAHVKYRIKNPGYPERLMNSTKPIQTS